jgi:16S rRNA (cytidine1402-2'-O)-methyltransferase
MEINLSNLTGTLYVVATPIGNLDDLSPRAIEIFKKVKFIAAEDTRHSKKLFNHYCLNPRVLSHHKFNEHKSDLKLIKFLENGNDIALISDAGTPLISDPGFGLVRLCHNKSIKVVPIPGPSALISALSVAGLPTDKFIFEGFLADKHSARVKQLRTLEYEMRTLVFYEAPHRIKELLQDVIEVFGAERIIVLARELTKKFETIKMGTVRDILDWIELDNNQQKGEFVVMVQGINKHDRRTSLETSSILRIILEELPLKKAAGITSKITGDSKNDVYQLGLELLEKKKSSS